jgi:hypothetical protein
LFSPNKNLLTKKPVAYATDFINLVRVTGLEPVRRKTHAPQTCLSANSSTLANINFFDISCQRMILYQTINKKSSLLKKYFTEFSAKMKLALE